MLCLVRYQEKEFTRTLGSFAPSTPVIIAEFDASLSGAGLIWFLRNHDAEVAVGVCAVDLTFLNFQDESSYQNLAEFLGAILAVLGHIILGRQGQNLALRGDSITALTWAITERPRGTNVTNASMIWTLLCIAADVNVVEVIHLPGIDNVRCDSLSRQGPSSSQSVKEEAQSMGIGEATVIEAQTNENIMQLLRLCDPNVVLNSEKEFMLFWKKARDIIHCILSLHPAASPTTSSTLFLPRTHEVRKANSLC